MNKIHFNLNKICVIFFSLLMKEAQIDESDFKSCQKFVAKAVKKDKFELLLNFMERKKEKTLGR